MGGERNRNAKRYITYVDFGGGITFVALNMSQPGFRRLGDMSSPEGPGQLASPTVDDSPFEWPAPTTLAMALIGAIATAALIMSIINTVNYDKRPWQDDSELPGNCTSFSPTVCGDIMQAGEIEADHISGGSIHADTIQSNHVDTTVLGVQTVCNDVLEHTESGTIPHDWAFQTLQGTGEPIEVPVPEFDTIAFPLDELAPGPIAVDDAVVTSSGLIVTATGSAISLIDDGGEIVIQIGEPEIYSESSGDDLQPPGNFQSTGVRIAFDASVLPAGAVGVSLDIVAQYSTETDFDFNVISGPISESFSGFNHDAGAPYLDTPIDGVTLIPGAALDNTFSKDALVYSGVDNCRLRIVSLAYVALPPPEPLGEPGLEMRLPSDLSPYIGKHISVCSNDANVHVVNVSDTGLSFDQAGEYTEMAFVGGGPCCVTLSASAADRLAVQLSQSSCVHFCKKFATSCVTSFNRLSDANVVLELDKAGTLPPTHSLVRITNPDPGSLLIDCDHIDDYVGRRFTVVNGGTTSQSVSILTGAQPCGAHFQLGDPLQGRQRASIIQLEADKGAMVEFVVVDADLIVVTSIHHGRRCDQDGFCSGIGEQLSLLGGWWVLDGPFSMDGNVRPTATLIHIDDSSYDQDGNRMSYEYFDGPPQFHHVSNRGVENEQLSDFVAPRTGFMQVLGPLEFIIDAGFGFGVRTGHINPMNPNEMAIQLWPLGPQPFPSLVIPEWLNGYEFTAPYIRYRRIASPNDFDGRTRNGQLPPPIFPLNFPDMLSVSNGLDDRRLLFKYYVQSQLHLYNSGVFATEPACDGVESFQWANDLAERIMRGETFTTTVDLTRAQRTNTARRVTTIETAEFHTVTTYSNVTFSGITGPWSVLNGDSSYRVAIGSNGVKRHAPGTIDTESLHYIFDIDFDSSLLPADNVTGYASLDGQMTVTHGPLTSDMEYKPFMDMIIFFDRQVFIESTHHFIRPIAYTSEDSIDRACRFSAETWADVKEDLATDPYGIHALSFDGRGDNIEELPVDQRRNNEDMSTRHTNSWARMYSNFRDEYSERLDVLACRLNSMGDLDLVAELENDPSGELMAPTVSEVDTEQKIMDNVLNMHTPYDNYAFDDGEGDGIGRWYNLVWRTDGAPGFDILGLQFAASFLYPPYDGSTGATLVGELARSDDLPCVNCNFLAATIPLNGPCESNSLCLNETACTDGLCESYYEYVRDTNPLLYAYWNTHTGCTVLNRTLFGGESIGYCRFSDTVQVDPLFLMTTRALAPGDTGNPANPRARREAASSIYAPMYQWLFTNQSVTDVIYDIRGNNGGLEYAPLTAAEFHGGQRARNSAKFYSAQHTATPRKLWDDEFDPYGYHAGLGMSSDASVQYPEINEALYPGSTNPDANVAIMSNWRAVSGGDIFLHAFVGDALDGDLNGTTAFVVGNPVGTLFGCNGGNGLVLPATPDSYVIRNDDTGVPIPYMWMSLDSACSSTSISGAAASCQRVPGTLPHPLDGLLGKDGGPAPPHDLELWHQEIGYVANPYPRLPGDDRPQTPVWPPVTAEDRKTRRDMWLERTAMTLLNGGAKKRGAHRHNENYQAQVEYYRDLLDATNAAARDEPVVSAVSCGADEVDAASIPRRRVGTIHYNSNAAIDPEEYAPFVEHDGHKLPRDQFARVLASIFDEMREAGTLCRRADGSVGFTAAATDIPLVDIAFD